MNYQEYNISMSLFIVRDEHYHDSVIKRWSVDIHRCWTIDVNNKILPRRRLNIVVTHCRQKKKSRYIFLLCLHFWVGDEISNIVRISGTKSGWNVLDVTVNVSVIQMTKMKCLFYSRSLALTDIRNYIHIYCSIYGRVRTRRTSSPIKNYNRFVTYWRPPSPIWAWLMVYLIGSRNKEAIVLAQVPRKIQ